MTGIGRISQLLIACWALGGDNAPIPTSNGLLDRALKLACDQGVFPDWARDQLHFVDSRIGLQCIELPEILDWAQKAALTTVPNPSYSKTEVGISRRAATYILNRINVSEDDATTWGGALRTLSTAKGHDRHAPTASARTRAGGRRPRG